MPTIYKKGTRYAGANILPAEVVQTTGTSTTSVMSQNAVTEHIGNTSNPHSVTKAQVGLGTVVNTGDSATPAEDGVQKFTTGGAYTELNKKVDKTTTVNGHTLDANVTVTKSDVGLGNVDNTRDADKPISTDTQTALNGKVSTATTVNEHPLSSNVTITKSDVGLGNCDNTSDANKPISTATQTALDGKLSLSGGTMTGSISTSSNVMLKGASNSNLYQICAGAQNHGASLILLGEDGTAGGEYIGGSFALRTQVQTPTAAYIDLVGNVNGVLKWGGKPILTSSNYSSYALPLTGGTLTGATYAPTADTSTNNTQIATTAYTQAQLNAKRVATGVDVNTLRTHGLYFCSDASTYYTNLPTTNDHNFFVAVKNNANGLTTSSRTIQLAIGANASTCWVRSTLNNDDTHWLGWKQILTSSSYSSYALPLSGGSLTGNQICRNVDNAFLKISGGTASESSGTVNVFGASGNGDLGGAVELKATNGSLTSYLRIYPNGTTYAPTPATSDNSNQIATTAYVTANKVKYIDWTVGDVTLNTSGYLAWSAMSGYPSISGTIINIAIITWGNSGGKCFTATIQYLMGESNASITNLKVRIAYI